MMAIGSVLVQPQRIRRSTGVGPDDALLDDLLSLATRLVVDQAQGGRVIDAIGAALEGVAGRMQAQAETNFATAQARLDAWIRPAIAFFEGIVDELAVPDSVAESFDIGQRLLTALSQIAGSLTLDRLRAHIILILDVVQNDLGITGRFIEQQIWALIDDVIARLEQSPPDLTVEERTNRVATVAVLRRLKRRFQAEFVFPQLDAEALARALLRLLRDSGILDITGRAACMTDRLADGATIGATLSRLVPFPAIGGEERLASPTDVPRVEGARRRGLAAGNGGSGVAHLALERATDVASRAPATGEVFAWYATWLLQGQDNAYFGLSELKNARQLLTKLKSGTDGVSRHLRQEFSAEARQELDAYIGGGDPSETLKLVVLAELNRLLRGPELYDEQRFAQVTLRESTRNLKSEGPNGEKLIVLNRILLEDAYPDELETLPWSFGDKETAGAGEWLRKKGAQFVDFIPGLFGWPGHQVWVDKDRRFVMHDDKPIFMGTNVTWNQAPIFAGGNPADRQKFYTFQHISPEFLEGWAYHSTWANDAIRFIWHLTKIQPNHWIGPVLNSSYDLAHLINVAAAQKPFSGYHFWGSKWFEWSFNGSVPLHLGLPFWLMLAGTFQGRHTQASGGNKASFWLTIFMGDLINTLGPISTTSLLRELSLTFMTLYNFGGPRDGPSSMPPHPAENHNHIAGIVDPTVSLFVYLLALCVDREDYTYLGKHPDNVTKIWWLGGLGMGLLAGFTGTVIAQIIAWAEDWEQLGITLLKSFWKPWLMFWPVLYVAREGDTDGGKFNATGGSFKGYPKKEREDGTLTPSPYLLPYAAGTSYYVGQANAGMWSHNRLASGNTIQTYAFDFGHDQADEILASRAGTVIDFDDSFEDENTSDWNFIVIRHDVDDAGNPIEADPNHDLDLSGQRAVTFAVYGHGRKNGVRDAFALWTPPVPRANIIGTRVKRGQPIMLAGDTGNSFHNHLHMHVIPEQRPAGGGSSVPASNATRNITYAIPFIFQDVGGDGVCQPRSWYTSTNTRRTS